MLRISFIYLLLIFIISNSLAWANEDDEDIYNISSSEINDPFEDFNRAMLRFNNTVDFFILHPLALSYGNFTPSTLQTGVENEINFLRQPVVLFNAVATWDQQSISDTIGRILVNGIFGLFGLIDVAAIADISDHQNSFANTLIHYGAPTDSPFLILPIIGPTDAVHAMGMPADYASSPTTHHLNSEQLYTKNVATIIHNKYRYYEFQSTLADSSLDEYSSLRSVYWQKRR